MLPDLPLNFPLPCQHLLNLHVQLGIEGVRYLDLHFFAHAFTEQLGEHLRLLCPPVRLDLLLRAHIRQVSRQAYTPRLTVIQ